MDNCPHCGIPLARDYGLPGVVGKCLSCREDFIKMLGKWISRKEYFERVDAEHN